MPETFRKINKKRKGKAVIEGAGVHLTRIFGFGETSRFDPFLMLDDFRSDTPEHYLKGFPWHPHRGIETITYILKGTVEHGDSLGNSGVIGPGDVQWMTAGSGIIHQEMPKGDKAGSMHGFQLWLNLPAAHKMTMPKYRDVQSKDVPEVARKDGKIKIVCGQVDGVKGPVTDVFADPTYLDIEVPPETKFTFDTKRGLNVMCYVIGGEGRFCQDKLADNGDILLFDDGDGISVVTESAPVRFLLLSGKPIKEPVAWYGPIVMNTDAELRLAFDEYNNGTFLKHSKPGAR